MSARYPSRAELEHREHSVYVLWCDDIPVYVGMTSNWEQRMSSHGMFSDYQRWNPTPTHADVWLLRCNRTEAERIEVETIRALMPLRNYQGYPYVAPEPFDRDNIRTLGDVRWAAMRRAVDAVA